MMTINYIVVPTLESEGGNTDKWLNGLCIATEEETHTTLYLGHYQENIVETLGDETEQERTITRAFAVRVEKPLTRDTAINACEMEAYGLHTAMDVASFNASLARKSRLDSEDSEVKEHDEFIQWVKDELTKIGV